MRSVLWSARSASTDKTCAWKSLVILDEAIFFFLETLTFVVLNKLKFYFDSADTEIIMNCVLIKINLEEDFPGIPQLLFCQFFWKPHKIEKNAPSDGRGAVLHPLNVQWRHLSGVAHSNTAIHNATRMGRMVSEDRSGRQHNASLGFVNSAVSNCLLCTFMSL